MRSSHVFLAVVLLPGLLVGAGFTYGVATFVDGSAHRYFVGLPGSEFFHLDARTGTYPKSRGCIPGLEFVVDIPNNLAIGVMADVFGPMRGSYRGPYPTKEEALDVLKRGGKPIDLPALEEGRLVMDGRSFELSRERPWGWYWSTLIEEDGWGRAAIIEDKLAVVEIAPRRFTHRPRIALLPLDGHPMVASYDDRNNESWMQAPSGQPW